VLVGITCVLALVAAVAFVRRDLNASLVTIRRTPALASHDPDAPRVWAMPVARLLYERRYELLAWIVGMSALAAIFVALTMSIVRPLLSIPELKPYLESFVHGSVFPSFVNLIWFGSAQLLMAGFAISQVAHWSAEDGDGRLEMFLSTPTSRLRVVVERLAALTVGAIAIAAGDPPSAGHGRCPHRIRLRQLLRPSAGADLQVAGLGPGHVRVQALRPA